MAGRMLAALVAGVLITSGAAVAFPTLAGASTASTASTVNTASTADTGLTTATGLTTSTILTGNAIDADRPSEVTVPAEYVYEPKHGPLHDYCTSAPDEFPAPHAVNADFRGPCARHDLCYEAAGDRKACDKALQRNMFRNCEHYYGRYNPLRTACKAVAVTYWAAVTLT